MDARTVAVSCSIAGDAVRVHVRRCNDFMCSSKRHCHPSVSGRHHTARFVAASERNVVNARGGLSQQDILNFFGEEGRIEAL